MTESTVEYLVGQHKRLSAEHERFNAEGRPAFAREIRIRLEAIELAIVGVSKAVDAPDTAHRDALQWAEGTATTKFGKYTILSVLPGYQLFTPDCAGKHRWVATVTEAKYAAQADYERRMAQDASGFIDALRAALEPFANAAVHYNACGVGHVVDHEERLTVGDLRLAKAAFETPGPTP